MSNERIGIIIDDLVQQATLSSVPTAVATLPANYLKTELHAEVMQVMGDTVTLSIEFVTPQQINAAVLCWHNLSSAAVVTLDLLDANDAVLQTLNPTTKASITAYFMARAVSKLRWVVTDARVEFIQIGRALAGLMWQPAYGVDNGIVWDWEDSTDQVRSKGGTIHYRLRPKYKKQAVSFHYLNITEVLTLYNIPRGMGVFMSVYKGWGTVLETTFEGIYAITESTKPTHDYNDRASAAAVFVEA